MSWRIFQKWFNIAPWPNANYITDNVGEKFWIHWGTHFGLGPKLYVYYKASWIGTVESAWREDGGLDLADIIIFEKYSHLRQRGLGKKMMQCFRDHAKKEGACYVLGFIQAHEGSSEEYLDEWYRRQGFQVTDTGLIYLDLRDEKE